MASRLRVDARSGASVRSAALEVAQRLASFNTIVIGEAEAAASNVTECLCI